MARSLDFLCLRCTSTMYSCAIYKEVDVTSGSPLPAPAPDVFRNLESELRLIGAEKTWGTTRREKGISRRSLLAEWCLASWSFNEIRESSQLLGFHSLVVVLPRKKGGTNGSPPPLGGCWGKTPSRFITDHFPLSILALCLLFYASPIESRGCKEQSAKLDPSSSGETLV